MRYKTNTTGYTKSINDHRRGGPTLGRPADYFLDDDGFVLFPDGSKYKGGLRNGNPDGVGTIIYADGSRYEGD